MTIGRNPVLRTSVMSRRQHATRSSTFNGQVAVIALRGDTPLAELAEKFEGH